MARSRYRFAAILMALSLFAAACGGSDEASSTDTATEEEASTETTLSVEDLAEENTDDVEETAVDGDPIPGGTLVIGSNQVPRHFNGLVQSGLATAVPGTQLNAGLIIYGDDFEPQPYLAESWEFADDGLSLTVKIVENAVFHDGVPVTSEDVAFSVITARDFHPFQTMFAPVVDVETPDEFTAVINLSQPHPALLLAMSPALLPIVPKHIYDDGQDLPTHPRNIEDFVGSGPFMLTEYDEGAVIRMEKFDDFFLEGLPYLDELIIEITPDPTTTILGLENGSVDLAVLAGSANILRAQDNDDLVVTSQGFEAVGQVNWLEFNLEDPVVGDPLVRQAIGYAIDRDFISDVLDQGLTIPALTGIAPGTQYYDDSVEAYDLNIETAKELLAEAGYAEGDLTLSIDYIPPTQSNYAEYIVQALEEIGITTELSVSPDFPTWATRVATGDYQMTLNNVWNWGDPVIGVHRSYLSTNRVGAIWTNNSNYVNEEVDTLLASAAVELDTDARAALYSEFQEIVAADVPMYFLTTSPFWQALQPSVQNGPVGVWGQLSPMHELWLAE